jgi:hypothetical protein
MLNRYYNSIIERQYSRSLLKCLKTEVRTLILLTSQLEESQVHQPAEWAQNLSSQLIGLILNNFLPPQKWIYYATHHKVTIVSNSNFVNLFSVLVEYHEGPDRVLNNNFPEKPN